MAMHPRRRGSTGERRENVDPGNDAPLIVVVGPTAAGKSDLALELAARLQAEVISADSQQVYRRFDVGTGKLTTEEQRGIPHHLLDIAEPDEPFSAARFVELADQAIAQIRQRGRRVVVVGGTGLYVRALLRGLFSAPPSDPDLRREHQRVWSEEGPGVLRRRLGEVDPEAVARFTPNDFVRISRALEVFEQTGVTISELQRRHGFAQIRYPAVLLGLAPERARLRQHIDARVESMMRRGWLDEVRLLLRDGHGETRPMGSLGYRQLRAHLRGELDLLEALRQTKRDTWRFAKRQLNWFSHEPDVRWFEDAVGVDWDRLSSITPRLD
jgi:tRNA dimethylallyltransferase